MSKHASSDIEEIEANFENFSKTWRAEQAAVSAALEKEKATFVLSYQRIVSLHAWRSYVLQDRIGEGSLAFFLEAQNDALVSHVLAQHGSWRVALKALRSCLENVLSALYYKDHPVELELWASGASRIPFSDLFAYFEQHPALKGVPAELTGLPTLKGEFGTLSRAVHGSAKGFRMTKDGKHILLWSSAKDSLGPWSAREHEVLAGVNALLVTLFRGALTGAALPGLRKAVGIAVPTKVAAGFKAFGVTLG
jgi:hypothetical protein